MKVVFVENDLECCWYLFYELYDKEDSYKCGDDSYVLCLLEGVDWVEGF